jgi:probable HAF family extracellular repeat protein
MPYRNRFYHSLRLFFLGLSFYGAAFIGVSAVSAADAVYDVETLSAFCCGLGDAFAVNELGVATGKSRGDSGGEIVDITVTWDTDGTLTQIDHNNQAFYTEGHAINDLGDVAGLFEISPSLWVNQVRTGLTGPPGTVNRGFANDIDNNRVVVGCVSETAFVSGPFFPIQWPNTPNGELIPGTPADARGCANAINNVGHITGEATIGGISHAVIWADGAMIDLGIPPGFVSCEGNGINDADHVAGYCDDSQGNSRPFLWRDGSIIELGITPGETGVAHDINNADEVLGYAGIPFSGGGAFVWRGGAIQDLTALTNSRELLAINNSGVIVGEIYRLTPQSSGVAGDINNDGLVDAADVLIGARILTGLVSATPEQISRGDVAPLVGGTPAPDGQFNLGDHVLITRKAIGSISF